MSRDLESDVQKHILDNHRLNEAICHLYLLDLELNASNKRLPDEHNAYTGGEFRHVALFSVGIS